MLAAMRVLAAGIVSLLVGTAHADRAPGSGSARFAGGRAGEDRAIDDLKRTLPAGWTLAHSRGELVIRRTATVKVAGRHLPNEPHYTNIPAKAPARAVEIQLALRYRTEPAWTAARFAEAREKNKRIGDQIRAARIRHRVDEIQKSKGRPLPTTDDERARLAAFEAESAKLTRSIIDFPCTLGAFSVFDDRDTYAQLDLMVEPQLAMREAYAVVELVKRRCRK